ncbi:hypothetical protein KM043_009271 [Ampulex compressa]|nr:hypothetical protein KM043_009271 [Ampulex compressa]
MFSRKCLPTKPSTVARLCWKLKRGVFLFHERQSILTGFALPDAWLNNSALSDSQGAEGKGRRVRRDLRPDSVQIDFALLADASSGVATRGSTLSSRYYSFHRVLLQKPEPSITALIDSPKIMDIDAIK